MDTFVRMRPDTSPERGSQVEGRNRQGYQQGGHDYNIDRTHHI